MMQPLSIYLHVPFCARKCAYCDFASFAGRGADMEPYFAALNAEIGTWAERLRASEVRSVFFGGGTPSLVPAQRIAETLGALRSAAVFAQDAEITLEANPGTLTREKLDIYRAAGVNRLSIGVQSLNAALLKSLGRIHTPEQAVSAVELAHAAGFDNLSVDLMYALPGQSAGDWQETLIAATALPLAHISAYSLIVEEGTELAARVAAGRARMPDDDAVNEMQRLATYLLADKGFLRYEISNYARPGFESRHNLNYWNGGDYLGLGSAAHSLVDNARFSNPPELESYLAGTRRVGETLRSRADQMEEMLMLSTRTVRGLPLARWRACFGEDFAARFHQPLEKLKNYGLAEMEDGFLRLTPAGLELQDAVVLELMDEI